MDKLIAVLIFVLALLAALVLFAVGKRRVRGRSENKYYGRYLVYLSAVLLFLGGFAGVVKVGSTVSYAQDAPEEKPDMSFEETPGFNSAMTYWDQFAVAKKVLAAWMKASSGPERERGKDYIAKLIEGKKKVFELIDDAVGKKQMSASMSAWLKFNLDLECDLLDPDMKLSDEYRAKGLKKGLEAQAAMVKELRDAGAYSKKLKPKLKLALELIFGKLADGKFANRLKHAGLSKDAYRKLVEQSVDLTYSYIMKVKQQASRPEPRPIEPREEYGVRPMYGVRPDPMPVPRPEYGVRPDPEPFPAPKPMYGVRPDPVEHPKKTKYIESIVDTIKGKVYFRQPMGIWSAISSRKTLYFTTLLENRGEEDAFVTFNSGKRFVLKPGEVVTGWELEIAYDPARMKKFNELVNQLSDDETRDKAVEELVAKYPNISRDKLPEVLKKSNRKSSEAKAIRAILDRIPKIAYSEAPKDNLE